ncbi:hypothetical protein HHK36_004036 [Tetracentron sinense]|uniref:Uncharacterized protein n=1 Tax=Tetracentron sinense TaxID=13715 RepID=A0A835DST7_TETSI|nr:hypothetical protein HHK36_004036 [Tetracentron sinense]
MKGREGKAAPPTDLLFCFPSRAHLNLLPKPICSPARPTEPSKRHHHHHHLTRSNNRSGQASPVLWAKTKPMDSEIAEPTSPKVTCAGQIKDRPNSKASCKNWQSVMEEIEKLHNKGKHKKRPTWVEALGFKKDNMQFLTYLRSLRFDFRCFSSLPGSDITSVEEEQEHQVGMEGSDGSRTIFSKWFMVLQENQNNGVSMEEREEGDVIAPSAPPPNALMLMRSRSAPAKSWLEEKEESKKAKLILEYEKKKENMVVMNYAPDYLKVSSAIKEDTRIDYGGRDPLSRSRSWKR